ncbi:probable methyltransferase PMT11 [Phalaenopsis equestris]|uniref:probable methyltransferase PMT11 n=1 Tax=Phalaenopsis equestris TaxID=78828 RepID=UPI0009E4A564|nr:probable methyltransferase PMT11 [Phalaenopsis equestris]
MKSELGDPFKLSSLTKISIFFLACVASFYLGRNWNDGFMYPQLVFYSNINPTAPADTANLSVIISPNLYHTPDISNVVSNGSFPSADFPPPDALSRSPPQPVNPENVGIVDANGAMREDFDAGPFDSDLGEEESPSRAGNETTYEMKKKDGTKSGIQKFSLCPERMREYIPCIDNEEEIKRLNSTERGERFERHCPAKELTLNCLVPAPQGYREPIPWPMSRDEVWFSNVPHTRLVEDKGGQNWIKRDGEKFKFPGGGTQFIHGAGSYLDQITKMVPDIAFGNLTRVVLDVGCGVASFGAFLISRDVITMSIAPKDIHENQIQFALERGVPAMVAAFATRRLPYPSQAFDLLHCSRCRINWTRDDVAKHCIPGVRLRRVFSSTDDGSQTTDYPMDTEPYVPRGTEPYVPSDAEFAAALIDLKMNSWVMNVVPISGPNTLPVIYDRGLIGVAHDWCEPFDTYPRTYDFLHAFGLFSIEHKRCADNKYTLAPGGRAYIRDSKYIIREIQEITEAMGWKTELRDTAEGQYSSRKILMGRKVPRHS